MTILKLHFSKVRKNNPTVSANAVTSVCIPGSFVVS